MRAKTISPRGTNNVIPVLLRLITAGMFAFFGLGARCQVLYNNTTAFLGNFDNGNGELGNHVSFPGTFASYLITQFEFQFDFTTPVPALNIQSLQSNSFQISWPASSLRSQLYSSADLTNWKLVTARAPQGGGSFQVTVPATNVAQFFRVTTPPAGGEMADMRFYKNDGAPSPPSEALSPGTLIWDSGTFSIGGYTEDSIATFYRSDLSNGVVVPQNFTWTVTFSGLSADETAGLALYQVATVGTNYGAAWVDDGTNWQFLTAEVGVPSPNFGALAFGAPVPPLQFSVQDGALALSWSTNAANFFLEMTTNLASPIQWVPLTNTVVINGQNIVTNTISGSCAFYRLVNDSLYAKY